MFFLTKFMDLFFCLQFEPEAQRAILERVAYYAELPNFASVPNMRPNACTCVVVAHTHNAQRVACVGREFAKVDAGGNIVSRHELNGYRQMLRDDRVNAAFNLGNLLFCGRAGQAVVALAFLSLNVSIAAAPAPEHPHHCLVKDVLYGMHWCD